MHNISGRGTGAAEVWRRREMPGRETAWAGEKYLWRCNDEWLVSQV